MQTVVHDESKIEVQEPGLRVERWVCTGNNGSCALQGRQAGSVLVAFTPLHFKSGGLENSLEAGQVAWVDAKQIVIAPQSPSPARLLPITPGMLKK